MPIRPEMRDRYPDDWPQISERIRFGRAAGRCECTGHCGKAKCRGRCRNEHGQPAYDTGKVVVLTTAHLNHMPEDCRSENLLAMCQGCHLRHDKDHHIQQASHTRAVKRAEGMTPLFDIARTSTTEEAARG